MTVASSSLVKRIPQVSKQEVVPFLKDRLSDLSWQDTLNAYTLETTLRQLALSSSLIPLLPELKLYARASFDTHPLIFDALYDLMSRIYQDFTFKPGITTVTTPLSEVAKTMKGVCQDYSHFMIACVRSMGLVCRYVSGYLETLPPPGQEKLQGADASHAWLAVYIPNFGWLDFDPTNKLIPLEQHVTVAWGRDYADVPPLKGVVYSNGNHELKVEVDMIRQELE
jgi:transglutaminase-like putative cysteine protease